MLIVTPKGLRNIVGDPCNLCLLFTINIITNTINKSNIIAVNTPIITSTYVLLFFFAATVNRNSMTCQSSLGVVLMHFYSNY